MQAFIAGYCEISLIKSVSLLLYRTLANAQGFKQTVCPNVYSEMSYYVTNGACTTADPGQPLYEPVKVPSRILRTFPTAS